MSKRCGIYGWVPWSGSKATGMPYPLLVVPFDGCPSFMSFLVEGHLLLPPSLKVVCTNLRHIVGKCGHILWRIQRATGFFISVIDCHKHHGNVWIRSGREVTCSCGNLDYLIRNSLYRLPVGLECWPEVFVSAFSCFRFLGLDFWGLGLSSCSLSLSPFPALHLFLNWYSFFQLGLY